MLPRIWIMLLTVLLLAAPAGSVSAEVVDAYTGVGLCDDTEVSEVVVAVPDSSRGSDIVAPRLDEIDPTAPELAGIFRPPRPPF